MSIALVASLTFAARPLPASDCNGNGADDVDDVQSAFSEDCNGNGLPDECEVLPLPMDDRNQGLVVGRSPRALVAADFDGDGHPDLLTGNRNTDVGLPSTVSLLLNQGDRTFAEAREYPAGDNLSAAVAADVDQDGDPDLVLASYHTITVLGNDEGALAIRRRYLLERKSRFVAAADLDGDSFPDLVTANAESDSISVFRNRRDGTFGAPVHLDAAERPSCVEVTDLDADDVPDLVVSHGRSSRILVYRGRADGPFLEPLVLEALDGGFFAVRAVDIDHDGDADLVAAALTSLSIFRNLGGGRFEAPRAFRLSSSADSLSATDVDRDGDPDLVVGFLNRGNVTVVLNDGNGSFHASVDVNLRSARTRTLIGDDLDGDGAPDLAVVPLDGDLVSVLWNADEPENGLLRFSSPVSYPVGTYPHTMALGDLDGDGDLDVATGNNHSQSVVLMRNNGSGTFADPQRFAEQLIVYSIAAGDLDGDGDLDLAGAYQDGGTVTVLENDGAANFRVTAPLRVGPNPSHVALADLDGDGRLDIITSNVGGNTVSILYGDSGARFTTASDVRVGSGPVAVAPSDLDGDGMTDLAIAQQNPPAASVLLNKGGRVFAAPVELPAVGQPNFVAAADLDRDGIPDLVLAETWQGAIAVYWGTGGGAFEPAMEIPLGRQPYSLFAADLDQDGYPDLVTANESQGSVSVLRNTGRRAFSLADDYPTGSGLRFAAAGDLDGDGDLDIVSANRNTMDLTVLLSRSGLSADDYLKEICTEKDFFRVSISSGGEGPVERVTKYVAPATDDPELLPTVFQNVVRFPLHEDFLREVFSERFPALSSEEYDQLVGRRATRRYFVGALARVRTGHEVLYTFSVAADTGFDARETPRLDEVRRVYDELRRHFRLEPLAYGPDSELARREAESWTSPPFPIFLETPTARTEYRPYTLGVGYGRVRVLTLEQFEERNGSGRFTFQDIIIVDEAPRDIEGVVGGIVTAEPQGDLSHVAVRTARRGTPNAYVSSARAAFSELEGRLVRLEIFETGYVAEEASLADAQAFWAANRPRLAREPAVDGTYRGLDHLLDLDLSGAGGTSPVDRYGGKAANMARLQRVLTGDLARYSEPGFAVPMAYYLEFLRGNTLTVDGRALSYEEYLESLLASPDFQGDSTVRFEMLARFREVMRDDGVVDPDLVAALARRIEEVFGSTTRMVRFRSSSNTEDSLEFNGAGLYESTSACAADSLDPAERDSSHCDPERETERTLERALKKVWASLWTFRAHEERTFFQIPPEAAAMGVLVTGAFLDEVVNGVAFTGNPLSGRDRRFVVTAQVGEESVVSPEPGTSPERSLLEMADGRVMRIFRDRSSSLVPPGEHVLSDEQLRELGEFMWRVEASFPVELEEHARDEVLLDFEFKIKPDGALALKQVRPFLAPISGIEAPVFEVVIPEGTAACGAFSTDRNGREPREEYETKSIVRFRPGTYELPSASDSFTADLIEDVVFGVERQRAEPAGDGTFRLIRIADVENRTIFRFVFEQEFVLPDGTAFSIELFGLNFTTRGGIPIEVSRTLDDRFLTFQLDMNGLIDGTPVTAYSSCGYSLLPEWIIEARAEDGLEVRLRERFLPSESNVSTGPASVVRGEVTLRGGEKRTVTDYWKLVYSARRHNTDERLWVVLDPPAVVPDLPRPVHAVELQIGRTLRRSFLRYLGEDFTVLAEPSLSAYDKNEGTGEAHFRRGDANADGERNLGDAIAVIVHLFAGGGKLPCLESADADDSGSIDLTDAVAILLYLFRGGDPLPEPFAECGVDETKDELSCGAYPACE